MSERAMWEAFLASTVSRTDGLALKDKLALLDKLNLQVSDFVVELKTRRINEMEDKESKSLTNRKLGFGLLSDGEAGTPVQKEVARDIKTWLNGDFGKGISEKIQQIKDLSSQEPKISLDVTQRQFIRLVGGDWGSVYHKKYSGPVVEDILVGGLPFKDFLECFRWSWVMSLFYHEKSDGVSADYLTEKDIRDLWLRLSASVKYAVRDCRVESFLNGEYLQLKFYKVDISDAVPVCRICMHHTRIRTLPWGDRKSTGKTSVLEVDDLWRQEDANSSGADNEMSANRKVLLEKTFSHLATTTNQKGKEFSETVFFASFYPCILFNWIKLLEKEEEGRGGLPTYVEKYFLSRRNKLWENYSRVISFLFPFTEMKDNKIILISYPEVSIELDLLDSASLPCVYGLNLRRLWDMTDDWEDSSQWSWLKRALKLIDNAR